MNNEIKNDFSEQLEELRRSLTSFRKNPKNNILIEDLVEVHCGGPTENLEIYFEKIEEGDINNGHVTIKDYTTAIMMANRVKNGPVMLPLDITRKIAMSRVLSMK